MRCHMKNERKTLRERMDSYELVNFFLFKLHKRNRQIIFHKMFECHILYFFFKLTPKPLYNERTSDICEKNLSYFFVKFRKLF